VRVTLLLLVFLALAGCATTAPLTMPTQEIQGDVALARMNDEELFAAGSSAFAAGDAKRAAACFERLLIGFPDSPHRMRAHFNAGLSRERLGDWDAARGHFQEIADAAGTGDALDAAFHQAETLYHLERYPEAATLLGQIAVRTDLATGRRLEAQVQQGVCQVDSGALDEGEKTLRAAVVAAQSAESRGEPVDDYLSAQAQFFLGEIYRLHCEAVSFDPEAKADQLSQTLEYKAELLLSSQGHYLRAIKVGNGYWATAAGERIGSLYEVLHTQMLESPVPHELNGEEAEVYRQELRRRIRILLTKAIGVYETTVATAQRIGAGGPFVDRARASLERMKLQLLAEASAGDDLVEEPAEPTPPPPARRRGLRPLVSPRPSPQPAGSGGGG
jgi:tetratricopeptide (TPR) repeat protein